jgi:hypothetical protein
MRRAAKGRKCGIKKSVSKDSKEINKIIIKNDAAGKMAHKSYGVFIFKALAPSH